MIVPSNALLAPLSPPQESQGTPEGEAGFEQLLAEIEQQASSLPGQEDGERRALESVLAFLATLFQSLTPATPVPAGATPDAGASGLASGLTAEGAAQAAALMPLSAHGLPATGIGRLLLQTTPHGSPSSGQLSVSDGTSETSSAGATLTIIPPEVAPLATVPGETTAAVPPAPSATSSEPDGPTPAHAGSALPHTGPLAAGDAALQATSTLSEASPLASTAPAPAAAHTVAPHLAEHPASALTILQGTASMPAAEERSAAELPQHAPEATPGLPSLAGGSLLPPQSEGTTPATAVEPDTTTPALPHTLEGADTRQWPRPLLSNTVLLHLEPRELGPLLVQVRLSENRLLASFRAQSSEAEGLLRTHLPALHATLSQQGFDVQPIAVSVGAEGFGPHTGAGSGASTQQHSTFHAFAQEQPVVKTGETRHEAEVSSILRQPAARGNRLLDVLI